MRPIGKPALDLIRDQPREEDIEWVFPRADRQASADMKKVFAAMFDKAGLSDARPHDLRRTFASIAADEGFGDATIAQLLGHARSGVTARHYIRRPDSALIAAADRVAKQIAAALDARKPRTVPVGSVLDES